MAFWDRFDAKALAARTAGKSVREIQLIFLQEIIKLETEFLETLGTAMNQTHSGAGDIFLQEVAGVREILEMVMNPSKNA